MGDTSFDQKRCFQPRFIEEPAVSSTFLSLTWRRFVGRSPPCGVRLRPGSWSSSHDLSLFLSVLGSIVAVVTRVAGWTACFTHFLSAVRAGIRAVAKVVLLASGFSPLGVHVWCGFRLPRLEEAYVDTIIRYSQEVSRWFEEDQKLSPGLMLLTFVNALSDSEVVYQRQFWRFWEKFPHFLRDSGLRTLRSMCCLRWWRLEICFFPRAPRI